MDKPVAELSEINWTDECGVIICLKRSSQEAIKRLLLARNVKETQIYEQRIYCQYTKEEAVLDKSNVMPQKVTGPFFHFKELDELGERYQTDKCHQHHDYLIKYEFFCDICGKKNSH